MRIARFATALIRQAFAVVLLTGVTLAQSAPSSKSALRAAYEAYQSGDYRAAEAQFREILKLDPTNAGVQNDSGSALLRLKKYDEAVKAFHLAADLLPEVKEIQKNIGQAYFQWGRYDRA